MASLVKKVHALESQYDDTQQKKIEAGHLYNLLPLTNYDDFQEFDKGMANNRFVSDSD